MLSDSRAHDLTNPEDSGSNPAVYEFLIYQLIIHEVNAKKNGDGQQYEH